MDIGRFTVKGIDYLFLESVTEQDLLNCCEIIKKHKLYVEEWLMISWIKKIEYDISKRIRVNWPRDFKIIVIKHKQKFVAVGCVHLNYAFHRHSNISNRFTMLYVIEDYRRQGLGTMLMNLLNPNNEPILARVGIPESELFWDRQTALLGTTIKIL